MDQCSCHQSDGLYAAKASCRPFYVWVKKEEEKGDQCARVDLQLITRDEPEEPFNVFTRSTRFTQTYPSMLFADLNPKKKKKNKKKKKDDDGEFICC